MVYKGTVLGSKSFKKLERKILPFVSRKTPPLLKLAIEFQMKHFLLYTEGTNKEIVF